VPRVSRTKRALHKLLNKLLNKLMKWTRLFSVWLR
jgi:hypothetical protein